MCGIAGMVVDDGLGERTELARLERMVAVLRHRGPDEYGLYRDASVGLAHSRLSIIDVVGELVVRGSNVMLSYWERPEESAAVLKAGRYPGERVLYTGDLFRMDEEGYLYFVSRQDEIIKSRGEKVSPKEVEDVIYELPGVFEALVVGVDDEILGQAIKAYIVPRDSQQLDAKQIKRHCLQHFENFMVPKWIEFVAGLPKTSSGKISRRAVMARSGEGAAT